MKNNSTGVILEEPLESTATKPAGVTLGGYGPKPPRRPVRPFRWLAALAILITLGLLVRSRVDVAGLLKPRPPADIATIHVRSGVLEKTLRLTGSTIAEDAVVLRAPYLRGRRSSGGSQDFSLVLKELAAPGSHIRRGDRVAAFDNIYMQNRLDDLRAARIDRELRLRSLHANLLAKRAAFDQQVRVAKAQMDKAALDLKTAPVRSAIQAAVFRLDFEEAKASYDALREQVRYVDLAEAADIHLAELALQEAEVEERRAQANVARMVVPAPVEGIVVASDILRGSEFGQIQVGDQVRPGQPYAQIVDRRSLVVEATVNQVDVEDLRLGAQAHIRFDAFPDLELPGRVYSIAPLAKSRGRRANYVAEVAVFVRLDSPDARLIPNLTVSADVVLQRDWCESIIPREATFDGGDQDQPFAYVRTSNGWDKRALDLGLQNHTEVAVHAGLGPDDVIGLSEPPT